MTNVQSFKCPSCGGSIEFSSELQKMKCPYCDTVIETSDIETDCAQQESGSDSSVNMSGFEFSSAALQNWDEQEIASLREFRCNSCGGELLVDDSTAGTSCPFCDSPVVLTERVTGTLKPNCVIPFCKNRDDARAGLLRHFKGKRLLPKVFKSENHVDEVKGVYVPFWLFSADADAKIQFDATDVNVYTVGDYEYTDTKHFDVVREGNLSFSNIEVDASSKMEDAMMNVIGPYNHDEAVDFNSAYLAGFLADKYDVSAEDSISRANAFIEESTIKAFENTVVGYSTVHRRAADIRIKNSSYTYALYPVWLLNTTWRGKKYVFAMNGQTGKFVGDLPMDKKLAAVWGASITAAITAITVCGAYLLWLF